MRRPLSVPLHTVEHLQFLDPDGNPIPGRAHLTDNGVEIDPMLGQIIVIPWETLMKILESPDSQEQLERTAFEGA